MLFKEKLLLANCDSVHAHGHEELRKRFLTGLAFADGVVLPPNTLIDNLELANALGQMNVIKYLNEEGKGKFVIRGFGLSRFATLQEFGLLSALTMAICLVTDLVLLPAILVRARL